MAQHFAPGTTADEARPDNISDTQRLRESWALASEASGCASDQDPHTEARRSTAERSSRW